MLARCRSLAYPHLFSHAIAAERVAGVSRLFLHALVGFLRAEDDLAVRQSSPRPFADRFWAFAMERENVCEKAFNTLIH